MAAASKVFLSFLLINLSSFFNPCLCDGGGGSSDGGGGSGSVDLDQILPGLGQNAIANAQCMHQLLPCQPFLKAPNDPPPTCCDPLKEMVTNSSDCLCQFINNPTMILSLEVSKDDIMKLPKACGIKVDISKCNANAVDGETSSKGASKEASAESTSSASKESNDASVDSTSSTSTEASAESTSSAKLITPYGITYFGVPAFVAFFTTLLFSA